MATLREGGAASVMAFNMSLVRIFARDFGPLVFTQVSLGRHPADNFIGEEWLNARICSDIRPEEKRPWDW
jgi:hypothetical protein